MWRDLVVLIALIVVPMWLSFGRWERSSDRLSVAQQIDEMSDSGIYKERFPQLTAYRFVSWAIAAFLAALCAVALIPM
ncbi:MAG: hypothetical protein O3A46_10925 [Candidatus Poribacteria bacterium]|nr:hypothetical protein [Candidatus Poribacteria bacterium]